MEDIMYLYEKVLLKEGLVETNATRLANAIDVLHSAISKLDYEQIKIFKQFTLNVRLKSFCIIEQLAKFDLDK